MADFSFMAPTSHIGKAMHTPPSTLWNKAFVLCLANNLFLFTFYFAQTTLLPIYILNDLNGSVTQAGFAVTIFLLSSILVRPFSGLIIERFGVRHTLYASEILFCLIALGYLWVDDFTSLFIIRFLHGICFSLVSTVTVPVAHNFIPEQRKGEGMGYFVMSINLAIVLGPFIALSLSQSWSYFAITSLLCGLVLLGLSFCYFIPVAKANAPKALRQGKLQFANLFEKAAISVSLMAMLVSFCYASIMSFISTFAKAYQLMAYAGSFFVVFAISMMSLRPITGKIYDRKGAHYVVYPALLIFVVGLVMLSQAQTPFWFLASAVFIGIGFGSAQPCLQTQAIQRAPRERIGYATATFLTFYDIGIAVGSFALAFVIAGYGYSSMYLSCAALILVSMLFYYYVVGHDSKKMAH